MIDGGLARLFAGKIAIELAAKQVAGHTQAPDDPPQLGGNETFAGRVAK